MPLPAAWWKWQYNRESTRWDRRSNDAPVAALRSEVVAMLRDAIDTDGPVLDVGCGPGAYARELPGFVVGADLAAGMLGAAAQHGGIALVQADAGCGLPFASDAFAGLLALLVLQHVPNPAAALAEMRRVVEPGAPLLVSVPAKSGQPLVRRSMYWRLRAWVAQVPGVIHRFSEDDVSALFADVEVVQLQHLGATYLVLARNRSEVP